MELYVKTIEDAIHQGIPDIIAHPDLFLRNRTFRKTSELTR